MWFNDSELLSNISCINSGEWKIPAQAVGHLIEWSWCWPGSGFFPFQQDKQDNSWCKRQVKKYFIESGGAISVLDFFLYNGQLFHQGICDLHALFQPLFAIAAAVIVGGFFKCFIAKCPVQCIHDIVVERDNCQQHFIAFLDIGFCFVTKDPWTLLNGVGICAEIFCPLCEQTLQLHSVLHLHLLRMSVLEWKYQDWNKKYLFHNSAKFGLIEL